MLNPHTAFTQITDVTAPFDAARASPIHTITLTLDDLDNILAFVQNVPPADPAAPIRAFSERSGLLWAKNT